MSLKKKVRTEAQTASDEKNGGQVRYQQGEQNSEARRCPRRQLDHLGVTPFVRMKDPFEGLDLSTPSPMPSLLHHQLESSGAADATRHDDSAVASGARCQQQLMFTPSPVVIPRQAAPQHWTVPQAARSEALNPQQQQGFSGASLSPMPTTVTGGYASARCGQTVLFSQQATMSELEKLAYCPSSPPQGAHRGIDGRVTSATSPPRHHYQDHYRPAPAPATATERPLNDNTPLRMMKSMFSRKAGPQQPNKSQTDDAPHAETHGIVSERPSDQERNSALTSLRLSSSASMILEEAPVPFSSTSCLMAASSSVAPSSQVQKQDQSAQQQALCSTAATQDVGSCSPPPWNLMKAARTLRAAPPAGTSSSTLQGNSGDNNDMSLEEYLLRQQTATAAFEASATHEGILFEKEQKVKFTLRHKLDCISRALEGHDRNKRGRLSVRDCIFFIGMHVLEPGEKGKSEKEKELFATIHSLLQKKRRALLLATPTVNSAASVGKESTGPSPLLHSALFVQPESAGGAASPSHRRQSGSPSTSTTLRHRSPTLSSSHSSGSKGVKAPFGLGVVRYDDVSRQMIDYKELLHVLSEL